MRVKLILFTFYLKGGLHAVSIGKLSERCKIFGLFGFSETKSETNFGFLHTPNDNIPKKQLYYSNLSTDLRRSNLSKKVVTQLEDNGSLYLLLKPNF